jgi:hypothetical protein
MFIRNIVEQPLLKYISVVLSKIRKIHGLRGLFGDRRYPQKPQNPDHLPRLHTYPVTST